VCANCLATSLQREGKLLPELLWAVSREGKGRGRRVCPTHVNHTINIVLPENRSNKRPVTERIIKLPPLIFHPVNQETLWFCSFVNCIIWQNHTVSHFHVFTGGAEIDAKSVGLQIMIMFIIYLTIDRGINSSATTLPAFGCRPPT